MARHGMCMFSIVGSLCMCVGTRVCANLQTKSCLHLHGWVLIYMPIVYTDTCIWVPVHGCVYRIIEMCVSLCLSLNRCQTQEIRKNRK